MKTIITLFVLSALFFDAEGQNAVDKVLVLIEENNATLKSLRDEAEAQKLENRTGIYLDSPEVGFNYLWGNPSDIGKRTDISVTQTFDISTVTGMKRRLASDKNQLVDWQYKADRMSILLEAKEYCLDLIYYNALRKELESRLRHAEIVEAGFRQKLEKGEIGLLEYNKIKLNLTTAKGEIMRADVERDALRRQLRRLNGGVEVSLEETNFPEISFPENFDTWYSQSEEKNPVLAYVRKQVELNKKQVALSKAAALPSISAGYMSEKLVGERFQGVTVGIAIPLWENKNRVKQAKAAVRASESREADEKQQFYDQLRILYDRTSGLKEAAEEYRRSLVDSDNTDLLKKALDAGEISLLDYILEVGLYYDTVNRALEAERDYQKAFAGLSAMEL